MTTKRILPHGQAFTTLHGVLTHGSDPSRGEPGNPVKHIQTVTSQIFHPSGGRDQIALLGGDYADQSASLLVADNDFSTGLATVILGNYEFKANVDYLVGANPTATAVNLAAAIDAIPEFIASNNGATVDVLRQPPLEEVEFRVLHLGSVVNFTTLVPDGGTMDPGGPGLRAPTIT